MLFSFRLQVFYECATLLNYTWAAHKLEISQPAVTKHIQEIEKELDIVLFNKRSSGVELTEGGRILLSYVERFRLNEEEMLKEINLYKINELPKDESLSEFSVGLIVEDYNADMRRRWSELDDFILSMKTIYPNLRVKIIADRVERLVEQFSDGGIDAIALVKNQSIDEFLRDTNGVMEVKSKDKFFTFKVRSEKSKIFGL